MRDNRVRMVVANALEDFPCEGPQVFFELDLPGAVWNRYGPGATVLPEVERVDRAVLRLPKGRRNLLACLHVLAARLNPDGEVWVCGSNDEGIKSADKVLEELFTEVDTLDTRRKCRLWRAKGLHVTPEPLDSFAEQVEVEVAGRTLRYRTLPGVFAEGRLDDGTRLLLQHLKVDPDADVLDFGCGAGVIGVFLDREVVGIDIDAWSVHCARHNGTLAYLSNGWSAVEAKFDHIISNPPFHAGKDTDFSVMQDLLVGASERLKRGGKLTFVAPATTPVQPTLEKHFKKVEKVATDRRYTVWNAV